MEEILSNGLINLSELAHRMWPDRTKKNAANLLRMKVKKVNGNSLNLSDVGAISEIIKRHADKMFKIRADEWVKE